MGLWAERQDACSQCFTTMDQLQAASHFVIQNMDIPGNTYDHSKQYTLTMSSIVCVLNWHMSYSQVLRQYSKKDMLSDRRGTSF